MPVEIRQHDPGKGLNHFLKAGKRVFADDPNWVQPLNMEVKDRLTPGKNPFFDHGEAKLFTAWKDGEVVGRCSASVDHRHLERWNDDVGFFGLLDTIEDPEVARALLDAAEAWLKERGMKTARGPICLSLNEEVGTLVEGHDCPPVLMMGHSRTYQADLITQAGYEKVKDLWAWRYDVNAAMHPRADRAWKAIMDMPEVSFRSVRKKDMESELRIIMEIFNDAWENNWGFVRATDAEVAKAAADMKLIIDEDMAFFAEIDGRPVGMCICMPNMNEAIKDLDGKLFPFGLPKLLWRLKMKNPKWGRLLMLGIAKELRGVKRYGGLSMALYVEISRRGRAKGYEHGELSWTLEDNHPVNLGIRAMGAKVYKKYRLFEKTIEA
jgi:hypothetical protein